MNYSQNGIKDFKSLNKKEILTQTEAANYFSITKHTLTAWERLNIVKPFRIGGRVYYRMKDIEALFNEMEGGVN